MKNTEESKLQERKVYGRKEYPRYSIKYSQKGPSMVALKKQCLGISCEA